MAQAANKFEDASRDLQQMLSTLMGQLSGLSATWKGLGADAFELVRADYEINLKKLTGALSATSVAIKESGQGYTHTDTEAASRVSGAGGGGFTLPL